MGVCVIISYEELRLNMRFKGDSIECKAIGFENVYPVELYWREENMKKTQKSNLKMFIVGVMVTVLVSSEYSYWVPV